VPGLGKKSQAGAEKKSVAQKRGLISEGGAVPGAMNRRQGGGSGGCYCLNPVDRCLKATELLKTRRNRRCSPEIACGGRKIMGTRVWSGRGRSSAAGGRFKKEGIRRRLPSTHDSGIQGGEPGGARKQNPERGTTENLKCKFGEKKPLREA